MRFISPLVLVVLLFGPARVWQPTELDRVLSANTVYDVLRLRSRSNKHAVRVAHHAVARNVHPDKYCSVPSDLRCKAAHRATVRVNRAMGEMLDHDEPPDGPRPP